MLNLQRGCILLEGKGRGVKADGPNLAGDARVAVARQGVPPENLLHGQRSKYVIHLFPFIHPNKLYNLRILVFTLHRLASPPAIHQNPGGALGRGRSSARPSPGERTLDELLRSDRIFFFFFFHFTNVDEFINEKRLDAGIVPNRTIVFIDIFYKEKKKRIYRRIYMFT